MRYRKLMVVGLWIAAIGLAANLPMAAAVAQQPVENPFGSGDEAAADPFGGDDHPAEQQISSTVIADKAASRRLNPDEVIRKALSEPATLDYDEDVWSDVEAELEAKYRINIVLSQSARDDSLTADEPISVNLRGIRLGNALRLMLMEKHATYVVKDQVLRIISLDEDIVNDPEYFTRRIIDVSKILRAADDWHQREEVNANNSPGVGMGMDDMGMDDMGMEMGMGGGRRRETPVRHTSEATLTELVLHSIQPDAWRDNPYAMPGRGGKKPTSTGLATCTPFYGRLIVNGPEQLLDEVEDFLREIEASLDEK